jgi:RNA polymerase sigma-70 factor, ECF subfamily
MDDPQASNDVQLLNTGDADALQRLILRCHGPLHGVIAGAIDAGLRHRLDADDVLQEAYAKVFAALGGAGGPPGGVGVSPANRPVFDNPGHFYKWLEAVALNQLRDMQTALRRQKRDAAREVACRTGTTDSYPNLIQQLAGQDPSPSRAIQKDEAIAAVLTSLARLEAEQRAVIRQRFLQDVPFEQIAERLGKSVEATYMICHRGLKNLRGFMVSITRYLTCA